MHPDRRKSLEMTACATAYRGLKSYSVVMASVCLENSSDQSMANAAEDQADAMRHDIVSALVDFGHQNLAALEEMLVMSRGLTSALEMAQERLFSEGN